MNLDSVESALRGMALPRAPQALRGRVLNEAKDALAGLRSARPRFAFVSVAGALAACAAVVSVILFAPAPSPPKTPETVEELLACLRDPMAPGRDRAVAALGELAGRKALPTAAVLLRDRDGDVRTASAVFLCAQGAVDAGVPALLREGRQLTVLNSLRHPEAWSALAKLPAPELTERTAPDRLRRIARAAGMSLSLPGPVTSEERRWVSESRSSQAPSTLAAALDAVLRESPYEALVEPGTIRIVPRSEALRFWQAWWDSK